MHPIFQTSGRVLTFLLSWATVGALLTIAFAREMQWMDAGMLFIPLGVLFGFISLSSWYLCRTFPVDTQRRRLATSVVHLVAAALASTAWVALTHSWALLLDVMNDTSVYRRLVVEQRPVLLITGALLFVLSTALQYLLIASEHAQAQATQALELKLAASKAELEAVRAQINPHFLFNSLNSVSALVTTDAHGARSMCLQLATYFRDTLKHGATTHIPLGQELSLARQYLDIERVRFGDRLRVSVLAPPETLDVPVPSLILQPLLENAIVHGVSSLLEGGDLAITANRTANYLALEVSNAVDTDTRSRTGLGFGLKLLRKRLNAQYGAAALLQVERQPERFRVELKLPLQPLTQGGPGHD